MNKKHCALVVCAALTALAMALVGCGDKTPKVKAPMVTPAAATFDLGEPADCVFTVDLGGGTVQTVKEGTAALVSASYAIKEGKLTLLKAYLSGWTIGDHACTLKTDGGEATFKVTVVNTKQPEVVPAVYDYDWALGGDLAVTAKLKGKTIVSLKLGETALTAENYTVANDTITLKEAFLEGVDPGENTFTLTTAAGSASFTVNPFNSTPETDQSEAYVMQGRNTDDLVYTLDAKGAEIAGVKVEGTTIEEASYALADGKFTLKGQYLKTLSAGIYTVEASLDNALESKLTFYAGTYGADGQAHLPSKEMDSSKLNNFENYAEGMQVIGGNPSPIPNTLEPSGTNRIVTGDDAINGKSLKITTNKNAADGTAVDTIFSTINDKSTYAVGKLYCFKLKIKKLAAMQVVLKWNKPDTNFLWLLANETVRAADTKSDFSKAEFDETTGVWDIEAYCEAKQADASFEILTINETGEAAGIVLDDIMILETDMPTEKTPAAPAVDHMAYRAGTAPSSPLASKQGFTLKGLYNGETALSADDYEYADGTLTVKESYLAGKTLPLTLTVKFDMVNGLNGAAVEKTNSFKVTEVLAEAGNTGIINVTTTGGDDAVFPIKLNGYSVTGVKLKGSGENADTSLAEADYTVSAAGLTIKNAYLSTLAAGGGGIKIFTVTTTCGDFTYAVNLNITVNNPIFSCGFETDSEWAWHKDNATFVEYDKFGGSKAVQLSVASGIGYGLSTLSAIGPLDAEKVYQVKFKVKVDPNGQFILAFNNRDDLSGETRDNAVWYNNSGHPGEWTSFGRTQTVISLGENLYEVCSYHKGTGSKIEVQVSGTHILDDFSMTEVTGITA